MPSGIKFFGEGLPYLKNNDLQGKLIAIEGTDGVGRSTQIELLTQWLKVRGYGVVVTGWTRSKLMRKAINYAKSGNMLDRMTFSLLYATDFADRLENQILPALRSGFIVICDRYVYSAFARDSVRESDMAWIREVYGFAPIPELVCYLRVDVDNLIPRVIESGGMDYWESGMDLHLANNIYDSFKKYQKKMIESYDQMAEDYGFEVLDARRSVEEIQNDLRNRIEKIIGSPSGDVVPFPPTGGANLNNAESKNKFLNQEVEDSLQDFQPSLLIPGAVGPLVGEEKQIQSLGGPSASLGEGKRERPFSSILCPPFHIPEGPGSKNS